MAYMPSDPDYNRFGSTEYTDAFVDEAPEVDPRACQVLLSRLRFMHSEYGITPEILYTGNPGESWIKDQFVMDAQGNMVELPSHRARVLMTIDHNPDVALREAYKTTLSKLDAYDRARLLHGDWSAMPNVERPFAFAFDKDRHIKPFKLDLRSPMWIWVDFNVDPFTALIAQQQGSLVGVAHEIAINGGTMQELAKRITALAPSVFLHRYTGDFNGSVRRIQSRSTASMWDDLLSELGARESQLDLEPNPTHKQSREDFNYFLHHGEFVVDPSCTGLIYDLQRVQVDTDGKIIKADRSQSSQRADLLDCFVAETPVRTMRGEIPISHVEVGDFAWTRQGWKKVVDQFNRGVRDVFEYTLSDGRIISCTPDHKFAINDGWASIRDVYLRKLELCSHSLNTEVSNSENTPSRNTTTAPRQGNATAGPYTDKCGLTFMGLFRKAMISTMQMIIRPTIRSKTLNASPSQSTQSTICEKGFWKTLSASPNLPRPVNWQPPNGMHRKLESSGTDNTLSIVDSDTKHSVNEAAFNAESNSLPEMQSLSSAPTTAKAQCEEPPKRTTYRGSVDTVDQNSWLTDILGADSVRADAQNQRTGPLYVVNERYIGRREVFDITVEVEHEFFANGMVVHNCARYGINTYLSRWITTHRQIHALQRHATLPSTDTLRGRGREIVDRYIGH